MTPHETLSRIIEHARTLADDFTPAELADCAALFHNINGAIKAVRAMKEETRDKQV